MLDSTVVTQSLQIEAHIRDPRSHCYLWWLQHIRRRLTNSRNSPSPHRRYYIGSKFCLHIRAVEQEPSYNYSRRDNTLGYRDLSKSSLLDNMRNRGPPWDHILILRTSSCHFYVKQILRGCRLTLWVLLTVLGQIRLRESHESPL